jgi:hypothetical protein
VKVFESMYSKSTKTNEKSSKVDGVNGKMNGVKLSANKQHGKHEMNGSLEKMNGEKELRKPV